MALVIKSRAEIISDLENTIKDRDSAIETGFGPTKDVVIDPVSLVLRDLYLQVKRTFDVQFLRNAERMTVEELDLFGESFGIKRRGAIRATGSVFFLTSNQPANDILIPAGTSIASTTVAGVREVQGFVTTRPVTLFSASAGAFFNPNTGNFEIEAPITALTPGTRGLVSANTIKTLQRAITGISGVVNKSATTGGRDQETNVQYAKRIRLVLLGLERGTENGVKRFALRDDRAIDALVVPPGDPLLIRSESVAGAVDVYVLGEEPTVHTQNEIFDGIDVVFDNEPLIFPDPVSRVTKGGSTVLVEGVDYFIVPDPILGGSSRARNLLRWNRSSVDLPSIGEDVAIEYVYDKLIPDIQSQIESDENNVLADVLYRRSTQVDVQLEVTIKITTDLALVEVEEDVRTAIRNFINTLGLGEDVVPSDLDLVIRAVPGVDFVFLPFDQLSKLGGIGANIIAIAKNEFAQIADSDITLNIST